MQGTDHTAGRVGSNHHCTWHHTPDRMHYYYHRIPVHSLALSTPVSESNPEYQTEYQSYSPECNHSPHSFGNSPGPHCTAEWLCRSGSSGGPHNLVHCIFPAYRNHIVVHQYNARHIQPDPKNWVFKSAYYHAQFQENKIQCFGRSLHCHSQ